jgi:hypothetical protein
VKLEYSTDGGATYPNQIAASAVNGSNAGCTAAAGTGCFVWTVPNAPTTLARVRITDTNDATVFDTSDANFSIRGSFVLTAPNGAEEWVVGSTRQLTWTTNGTIANVKLEYSKDNFLTATVITLSTANAGFYNWVVPNDISATVRVRVSDANDPDVKDASDADFKIRGGFDLAAPNGGEVW